MSADSEPINEIDAGQEQDISDVFRKILQNPELTEEERVDQLTKIYRALEGKVDQDPLLIQFFNKRGFNRALERQILLSKRYSDLSGGALLCIDIDQFKRVNDTLGHPAGDKFIELCGEQITKTIRESDLRGRVGGDEMAVYLVHTDIENAQAKAELIRASIIEAVKAAFPNLSWEQTVSIGLASWQEGDTPQQLQEKADKALYQAKEERNKVVVYQK